MNEIFGPVYYKFETDSNSEWWGLHFFSFPFLNWKRLKIYFMSKYKLFLYQWTFILIDKHVPGVFIIM